MNIFSRNRKRQQRLQLASAKLPFRTRNGNTVSIIGGWIRITGIWLGSNGRGIHWIAAICIACFIITSASQVIALVQAKDDEEKLFECFSILSFCGMGLLKLLSLRGRQERWRSLLSSATDLEYQQLNCENPANVEYDSDGEEDDTFSKYIKVYTKKFTSTSSLLARIYTFTAIVYILSPYVEYCLHKFHRVEILQYPHILPGWAPLDAFSFGGYMITVIAEGMAAIYCVCVHIAFDLLAVGMMIFIHGQFLLLHDYCERIGGRGKNYDISRKRDARAHYRIAKCHKIRITLMKMVTELSSLTQNILGIYFVVAALTLCSVAVRFKPESIFALQKMGPLGRRAWSTSVHSTGDPGVLPKRIGRQEELSTTQLISLLQYTCGVLTQLFLYCNYGDAVVNESAIGLGEGPFASAWWGLSRRIRREVALLCVSMTRHCRLLAGPFMSLDLPAFIQIVRTAYSYYAVIRQKMD